MGRDQDYAEFVGFIPVCLICGERHHGRICQDGSIMCVYCMAIVKVENLAFDGNDRTDVCVPCWEAEQRKLSRMNRNEGQSGT